MRQIILAFSFLVFSRMFHHGAFIMSSFRRAVYGMSLIKLLKLLLDECILEQGIIEMLLRSMNQLPATREEERV